MRLGEVDGPEERDGQRVRAGQPGPEGPDGFGQAAEPGPAVHEDADAQVDVPDTGAGHLLTQPPDDHDHLRSFVMHLGLSASYDGPLASVGGKLPARAGTRSRGNAGGQVPAPSTATSRSA